MAIKEILSTDTLETGFRAKYNETIREIINGVEYPPAVIEGSILRLKKFGGGYIDVNLGAYYYTKTEVAEIINNILSNVDPLEIPIPTNSDGFFEYPYNGSHGNVPQYYVQLIDGDLNKINTAISVEINADADKITARGDFSADSYQLVIRK